MQYLDKVYAKLIERLGLKYNVNILESSFSEEELAEIQANKNLKRKRIIWAWACSLGWGLMTLIEACIYVLAFRVACVKIISHLRSLYFAFFSKSYFLGLLVQHILLEIASLIKSRKSIFYQYIYLHH